MQSAIVEPPSPFLKFVPENEQTYFVKKITSILQTDKENVIEIKPQIEVNKMQIGEDQVDEYLIEVGELVKLKKENDWRRKTVLSEQLLDCQGTSLIQCRRGNKFLVKNPPLKKKVPLSHIKQDQLLLNLNILVKLRPQESPYISMFTCNCVMEILKLYLRKTEFKEEDLSMRWKYGFFMENQKIGEVLVWNDVRGDDLFANIAIRMRLGMITENEKQFVGDLLQQFGSRLNISKNLHQTASKIHQLYQSQLMFLGEEVLIKRRQPNQWEDMVRGKFVRVNEVGHAILEGVEGNEEEIEDGYMELKGEVEELSGEEDVAEEGHLEEIGIGI